ncbi:Ger(x)C family spore germination protein [Paenibacillus ginsengihumi]|uniref:Ger(x)C family spore germination protein n=1 Tax=Paenibacillus ginsengihumi TaxID=431596 RepID=UPI00039A4B2B|nr:Ger(x)C family spore germination protein [Paenibacillus ginsengihumi]
MRNPWSRRVSLLLMMTLLVPLVTGCWDRLEIEERAVVLGIGIDVPEAGTFEENQVTHRSDIPLKKSKRVHLTAQIAVPGRIPLGPGEGGGGGGGGGMQTVWVVEADGHTIEDAMNNMQQRVSSPLFFGHLRVIVISEEYARRGVQNLNDYFHRNPEVRRMNWLLVSKNSARELMKVSPKLERVPSLYLMTSLDQAVKMGKLPNLFLGYFWSSVAAKGREGTLPYVELQDSGTLEIRGLALFRGDQMVGATLPIEILSYLGIEGVNQGGGLVFSQVPDVEDEEVIFSSSSRHSKIKVKIKNGIPHATIRVYMEGNLMEKSSDRFRLNSEMILSIEKQLQENAKKGYVRLLQKTQKYGSDIFGFGEYVRAFEPRYWNREIRTLENWQKMYRKMTFDIFVDINIRRIGMKGR